MTPWHTTAERPLTPESLDAVFDNEVPVVRIKDFCTPDECRAFAAAIAKGRMQTYRLAPVGYIGTAQVEYRWGHQKSEYFEAAARAWKDWQDVVNAAWDPLDRLIRVLSEVSGVPVGVADEPDFGRLFAGIIRRAPRGIGRHADYAPFNAPDYQIGKIEAQLGWNLFLEVPGSGGETILYNRPWNAEVRPGEEPPMSYGLGDDVIAGAASVRYSARPGDVVIFNSRNPHEVSPGTGGERLQIGSFIGRQRDGSLVLWS
jgi:hypothetical protein